jgi:hypothetical protein
MSGFVILLAFLAVLGAVHSFRSDELLTGAEFACASAGLSGLAIAFTLPMRCRVVTTRGGECGNVAYGVLFGCTMAAGHWSGKFRARLGLPRHEPRRPPSVLHRGGTAGVAAEALPIVITVAGGAGGVCAFWFALIGTASGVASFALAVTQVH